MKIKKKLRDITAKEYAKWKAKVCMHPIKCNTCLFNSANCSTSEKSWVNNKNIYSDEFLSQEIEVGVKDILTDEEREYLENVLKPFKDDVRYIVKQNRPTGPDYSDSEYEYITIIINNTTNIAWFGQEYLVFPLFKKGTMYKNMEVDMPYTLDELGLFLEEA